MAKDLPPRLSIEEAFIAAAEQVKSLKESPSQEQLLELYAWYKQATVGDNLTARPGMFELKAKAKWDAWSALKGTPQLNAQQSYIELAEKLQKIPEL
jgi:diazepam-binding inhibitor (GABA receptor modulating acyl-CoA-binding protein)